MGSFFKKVDKSLLKSGKVTIPNDEIENICDTTGWNTKTKKRINLIFNNKTYNATLSYKSRNSKNKKGKPYFQLTFNKDLTKELRKEFIQTFMAIQSEILSLSNRDKYHITSDEINREVIQFKQISESDIEIISFLKIKTPYDNLFKTLIETNILDFNQNKKSEDIIKYSSDWIPKDKLNNYKSIEYVVYYLVDEKNKEIYIGSATNLYERISIYRNEIPEWNIFKYEVINPKFRDLLLRIEEHSIRAFASFLPTNIDTDTLNISTYKLNNRNWSKRR